ncbi:MAG: hypothetical protein PHD13_01100 [Methanocellales archaeon]|nr:hypothetical protein [Methanocellales archaeon]MDD3291351.1 hypothetical protein [Methanocellales archaeon]MDD5234759.1 hypothetical protein [Methanocellales archaeon]MDD5484890.1 hypothetical protein [Methanocellales archaeon]
MSLLSLLQRVERFIERVESHLEGGEIKYPIGSTQTRILENIVNDVIEETGYSPALPAQMLSISGLYYHYSATLDLLEDIHAHLRALVEEQSIVDYKKENELLKTLLKEVFGSIVH